MGSSSLLQVIFPTQGSAPGFPHLRWKMSYQGSPRMLEQVACPFARGHPDPGIPSPGVIQTQESLPQESSRPRNPSSRGHPDPGTPPPGVIQTQESLLQGSSRPRNPSFRGHPGPGIEPSLLHCRGVLHQQSYQGSPFQKKQAPV